MAGARRFLVEASPALEGLADDVPGYRYGGMVATTPPTPGVELRPTREIGCSSPEGDGAEPKASCSRSA